MKIILASKSPRRTQILTKFNITHEVIPSDSDECVNLNQTVEKIVEDISYTKAVDVYNSHKDSLVIGADTIVVINNEILGKPKDESDAIRMLSMLQGNTHKVITGVTIMYKNTSHQFHTTSYVTFDKMTKEDILSYISKEYIYDKAGSYAVQGENATFISKIDGSFYNVMGLPIEDLIEKLSIITKN